MHIQNIYSLWCWGNETFHYWDLRKEKLQNCNVWVFFIQKYLFQQCFRIIGHILGKTGLFCPLSRWDVSESDNSFLLIKNICFVRIGDHPVKYIKAAGAFHSPPVVSYEFYHTWDGIPPKPASGYGSAFVPIESVLCHLKTWGSHFSWNLQRTCFSPQLLPVDSFYCSAAKNFTDESLKVYLIPVETWMALSEEWFGWKGGSSVCLWGGGAQQEGNQSRGESEKEEEEMRTRGNRSWMTGLWLRWQGSESQQQWNDREVSQWPQCLHYWK